MVFGAGRLKKLLVFISALGVLFLVVAYWQFIRPSDQSQPTEVIGTSTKLYFAYGSNMNTTHMKGRCGQGAKPIGIARLDGYEFGFDKRGYANIRELDDGFVWGVVWRIDKACIKSLDTYEGYPMMYDRRNVVVNLAGKNLAAFVYIEPASEFGGQPRSDYLQKLVLPGARENGLPVNWIDKLEKY